ncbi:MAG: ABC transporter ATP-binding protein/permease [Acetobacteraceae bacterium]
MRNIGSLLADAWRLSSPYYRSEERWFARGILAAIIILGFVIVGLTVQLNFWNGAFYDSLQNKDLDGFLRLLLLYRWDENGFMPGFVPIVSLYMPLAILRSYLEQFLSIRWRRWMTNQLLGQWLADRAYYTIGLTTAPGGGGTDNPDQRIAEDVRDFTQNTLTLGVGFISKVTSLFNFAIILWSLSGTITLLGIAIPGYMLLGALFYAVVGTWLTHLVGKPLISLNFLQQRAEADFRFALVRFRENAEGVALSHGEQEERAVLSGRFGEVARNWFRIMNRELRLNALVFTYDQAAVIFPFVLGAPRYFAGEIALGGLMRTVSAFSRVQDALSWFVNNYAELARWRATVNRLITFQAAIATARALSGAGPAVAEGGDGVSLREADVQLPDGTPLLQRADLVLQRGESVAISGRSGSGKSTLFRAIAGIWPFGRGRIERAPGTYLFLPQRPYLPLGTLRHAVSYPAAGDRFADEQVRRALTQAGLQQLAGRLDEDAAWGQQLSGGEQQRLAIARALLLRPDWLFLDEATASLDPEAEAELYAAISRNLPETTVVSIAHRQDVARFHDQALVLQRRPGSPGTLEPRQPATMASTAAP